MSLPKFPSLINDLKKELNNETLKDRSLKSGTGQRKLASLPPLDNSSENHNQSLKQSLYKSEKIEDGLDIEDGSCKETPLIRSDPVKEVSFIKDNKDIYFEDIPLSEEDKEIDSESTEDKWPDERNYFEDIPIESNYNDVELDTYFEDIPLMNDVIDEGGLEGELEGEVKVANVITQDETVGTESISLPKLPELPDLPKDVIDVSDDSLETEVEVEQVELTAESSGELSSTEEELPSIEDLDGNVGDSLDSTNESSVYESTKDVGESDGDVEDIEDVEEFNEEDYSFLPQVEFDDPDELDDPDETHIDKELEGDNRFKELDEDGLKDFVSNLKSKIPFLNKNQSGSISQKKTGKLKEASEPGEGSNDPKKLVGLIEAIKLKLGKGGSSDKVKDGRSKINDSKARDSKTLITRVIYVLIAFVILATIILFVGKYSSGGYTPLNEIVTQAKEEDLAVQLDKFAFVDSGNVSFRIINAGDMSANFFARITFKAKTSLFKSEEIHCESDIIALEPDGIVDEKLKCDDFKEGLEYKIDVEVNKV